MRLRNQYLQQAIVPVLTNSGVADHAPAAAHRAPSQWRKALLRAGVAGLILALPMAAGFGFVFEPSRARATLQGALPILERNMDVSRARATEAPRSEEDQAIFGGWPLYRTDTGQTAFNTAMATLKATQSAAPRPDAFAGCADLNCNLKLPQIGADGWIPAGRIWVSPDDYVLIVHSPRLPAGSSYRRRSSSSMRFFIFHEFHNSTRNTDPYDTISSHNRSVFVPLYMSKEGVDADGRHFVAIVQVAPHDVVSVHASNMGSKGPGIEVAKNYTDPLQPLQAKAGVLVASIIKDAEPHLKVVNHRGREGRPMLDAYNNRLAALRAKAEIETIALPFIPASDWLVATASAELAELKALEGTTANTLVASNSRQTPSRSLAESQQVPAPRLLASTNLPLTQYAILLTLVEPPRLLSSQP